MMTKNLNYMIDFLCQIKILQLKMLKLLKILGFSRLFDQIYRFFQVFFKISQIPGFSRLFQPKLSSSKFFQVKWQPCIYGPNSSPKHFNLQNSLCSTDGWIRFIRYIHKRILNQILIHIGCLLKGNFIKTWILLVTPPENIFSKSIPLKAFFC